MDTGSIYRFLLNAAAEQVRNPMAKAGGLHSLTAMNTNTEKEGWRFLPMQKCRGTRATKFRWSVVNRELFATTS
ncbi:hypothetical protein KTT_22070 [Tengunoibacter tsumagoiensis]|uniref:Uncharacterized protein n=1 Tax=Tengunoibacter tsumagoiensis TaxID=2014871 RepID=A0A401ZZQ1_9CHLR|nr:hypothetical protein KTT_22070 [Tengunoibacter tsumagoiensis]